MPDKADTPTLRNVFLIQAQYHGARILKLVQDRFADGTDPHVWSLWSLDRIRQVNREYNGPLTAFSDGLIDSFYFWLRYEDELISSVWTDQMSDIASNMRRFAPTSSPSERALARGFPSRHGLCCWHWNLAMKPVRASWMNRSPGACSSIRLVPQHCASCRP